jgi:hypothetical protein
MTEKQSHNILLMILKSSITKFTNIILTSYISKIIDYHMDVDNIPILQDVYLNIIKTERDLSYTKFIKAEKFKAINNNSHLEKTKFKRKSNNLILNITEKYKSCIDKYHKIFNEFELLKIKYNNLINSSNECQSLFLNQINSYKDLLIINKSLIQSNNLYKNEINSLNNKLLSLKNKQIEYTKYNEPITKTDTSIDDFNVPDTTYFDDEC